MINTIRLKSKEIREIFLRKSKSDKISLLIFEGIMVSEKLKIKHKHEFDIICSRLLRYCSQHYVILHFSMLEWLLA